MQNSERCMQKSLERCIKNIEHSHTKNDDILFRKRMPFLFFFRWHLCFSFSMIGCFLDYRTFRDEGLFEARREGKSGAIVFQ